ncbi:hypothetical protein FHS29_001709 [Saccharothrix tamanrassetensis]|uniref:Uncharacterized protein n=1 Tax=Saccharothrix tamanrassetensis TaxID=1051531 RepID=A0A841CCL9_9PSEU|nr:hypothetical protein [Saccharothrix tamanrassetensis]
MVDWAVGVEVAYRTGFAHNQCENLSVMSEHGRFPDASAQRSDGERQRFLWRVCAVTGSRQISWSVLTGPREAEAVPRR